MRMRVGRGRLAVALVVLATLAPGRAPGAESPEGAAPAAARATLEALLADLWAVTSGTASDAVKRDAAWKLVETHLDTAALARGALGPAAERFTREEYADFAEEYSRYVTWLLVRRIADAEQPAELLEVSAAEGSERVHARVRGRERRRAFDFQRHAPPGRVEIRLSLRQSYGEWRVAGMSFDGVDVSADFRDQFASVLQGSAPADLIADLRRRNRENASQNPFAAR